MSLAPLNVFIDKSQTFDSISYYHIPQCSSIKLIMRIITMCNVSSPTVPLQNVTTDIVRHISRDQFQSAIQSHPHGPWQLNGIVLSDMSNGF
jgi:hypothetical protein